MRDGGAGYRSRYLLHAMRALYHLSYAPWLTQYWKQNYCLKGKAKIFSGQLLSVQSTNVHPNWFFILSLLLCWEFWIQISSLQVAHLPTHHIIQETQLYKMNTSNYYYYPYTMYNPYYFHFYSAREMLMHVFFELLLLIFLPKSYFYYKFCTYIWRGVFTTCHLK